MGQTNTVDVKWLDKLCFEADIQGHKLLMDSGTEPESDYKGASPKPFMLSALGGCTGMDVIAILRKMKIEPKYFNVRVTGTLTDDHPRQYCAMHIIFEIKGKDIPLEKIEFAIRLSEDKYCGVWAVYKKVMPVTWEIRMLN